MNKISTEIFKKFGKLITSVVEKGNQYYESIYLDFKNQVAVFQNSYSVSKLPFLYEGEVLDSIFVEATKFIVACRFYDYLEIEVQDNGNYLFKNGKDEFIFHSLKEQVDLLPEKSELSDSTKIIIDKNFITSMDFMEKDINSGLAGVFYRNGKIVTTNRSKFFSDISQTDKDVDLPLQVCYYLQKLKTSNENYEVIIGFNDKKILIQYKELESWLSLKYNLDVPDIESEEFKKLYMHETSFRVNFKEFYEAFGFIKSFSKDLNLTGVQLLVEENILYLQIISDTKIKKSVLPLDISEELEGLLIWVGFDTLNLALESLKSESTEVLESSELLFRISKESPIINITCQDFINRNIIIVKQKGE